MARIIRRSRGAPHIRQSDFASPRSRIGPVGGRRKSWQRDRCSRLKFRPAQAPPRRTLPRSKSMMLTAPWPSTRMLCAFRSAWSTPAAWSSAIVDPTRLQVLSPNGAVASAPLIGGRAGDAARDQIAAIPEPVPLVARSHGHRHRQPPRRQVGQQTIFRKGADPGFPGPQVPVTGQPGDESAAAIMAQHPVFAPMIDEPGGAAPAADRRDASVAGPEPGIEKLLRRARSHRPTRTIDARRVDASSVEKGGIGKDGAARCSHASAVHHVCGVYHLRPASNFAKMRA